MTKTDMAKEYSFWIGLQKSAKNVLLTLIVPGALYLLVNAKEWLPEEMTTVVTILSALGLYLGKNYQENK